MARGGTRVNDAGERLNVCSKAAESEHWNCNGPIKLDGSEMNEASTVLNREILEANDFEAGAIEFDKCIKLEDKEESTVAETTRDVFVWENRRATLGDGSTTDIVAGKLEDVDDDIVESETNGGATFRGLTYTQQLEKIISSVLHEEYFLFTETELAVFEVFRSINEDSRLLFIQLLCREHKLMRVDKQKFCRVKDRHAACRTLCRTDVAFAENVPPATLDALLACKDLLTVQDLQGYAHWCGLRKFSSLKRTDLVRELKNHVRAYGTTQSTLHTYFRPMSAAPGVTPKKNREAELVEWIIKDIGPVIRMADDKRNLFYRLLLIFNRTTMHPFDAYGRRENPMANSILANMRVSPRRFYGYVVHRCPLVWPTRAALLEYEALLETEVGISQMTLSSTTIKNEDGEHRERALAVVEEHRSRWESLIALPPREREHFTGVFWMNVFTPGWVLTRIMDQGVSLLGSTPLPAKDLPAAQMKAAMEKRTKTFEKEIELLRKLLSQQLFRPSARGSWWDRLAVIYHHHFGITYKGRREKENTEALETAWSICMSALEDKWVETGHRKAIETRLLRLRSRLRKATSTLHFPGWQKGTCVRIYANKVKKPGVPNVGMKCEYLLEDGRTIGVEELALEFYAARGWKGFHSETSILSTLYGLLFWDIIYMDNIPGVFASEFQTCPLDMRTEFFYESRREVIETRLAEIEHSAKQGDGRASDIETLIRRVDEQEREKGTLCVGVTWKYGREDLIDIAEGIGGPALAKICGLFARTYWAYSSGVPDLCLWKPETRELKIVEVKSDKDRFSQQQMVWIHLLTVFGLSVEAFYVEDSNTPLKKRRQK